MTGATDAEALTPSRVTVVSAHGSFGTSLIFLRWLDMSWTLVVHGGAADSIADESVPRERCARSIVFLASCACCSHVAMAAQFIAMCGASAPIER